jgi:2-oxoglutarate dehydrogenase E2 component (dihydrolipoamide succinyltransferase)
MASYDLVLPDLGMDGQEMKVSVWLVRRGESLSVGDRVVEVLAGPAAIDIPSPVDGVLRQKLVGEDEPLSVGQRLAVIEV